jgi:hypothetical protein
MKLSTKSTAHVLVALLISGSVLGFGGNHGKKVEPLTVLPLKADMRHQLAINNGIVSDARAPVVPQVELVLTRLDDTLTTLEFRNVTDKPIKMKLFLVQADGRFVATSSCPIEPGGTSVESWEDAFDAIGFGLAVELALDAPKTCN